MTDTSSASGLSRNQQQQREMRRIDDQRDSSFSFDTPHSDPLSSSASSASSLSASMAGTPAGFSLSAATTYMSASTYGTSIAAKTPNAAVSTKNAAAEAYRASLRSSWLLRLFQSEFFDARLALIYLHKYPESVGIQHYICNALRSFPESDIRFILPQICHMLVTRPEESVAIEGLITDICRSSHHIAIMTLWYLEASLREMQRHGICNASFLLCQRMYHTCQTIVFDDTPSESTTKSPRTHSSPQKASASAVSQSEPLISKPKNHTLPSATTTLEYTTKPQQQQHMLPQARIQMHTHLVTAKSHSRARSLNHSRSSSNVHSRSHSNRSGVFGRIFYRVPPAVVGIGVIMSGLAAPSIHQSSARMIISQTTHPRLIDNLEETQTKPGLFGIINEFMDSDDFDYSTGSDEDEHDETSGIDTANSGAQHNGFDRTSHNGTLALDPSPQRSHGFLPHGLFANLRLLARIPTSSPSLEELSKGSAFSFSNFVRKASSILPGSTSRSTPPVRNPGHDSITFSTNPKGSSGENISPAPSSAPLALNERRSVDILPSQLRRSLSISEGSSSIVHEQAHLLKSHYFHAEMQFIMTLVDISDRLRYVPKSARQSMLGAELTLLNHNLPADVCIPFWCPAEAGRHHHHHVVRINPTDAVVLNSADRVPYLIMVEVVQAGQPIAGRGSIPKTSENKSAHERPTESSAAFPPLATSTHVSHASPQNTHQIQPTFTESQRPSRTSIDSQLSESHRSGSSDMSRSPNTSSAEYYREVLQRRQSFSIAAKQQQQQQQHTHQKLSTPASMTTAVAPSDNQSPTQGADALQTMSANSATELVHLPLPHPANHPPVTTDEFSDRMRTAAVMLAQLYQQQQRDVVVPAAGSNAPAAPVVPQPQRQGILGGFGAGGIWAGPKTEPSSGSSTPSMSLDRSRSPSAAPALSSQANPASDRRAYNNMRTDFEEIRGRVIKEMMSLEQQRIETLSQQLGGSIDVVSGVDEILPEQQERRIRTEVFPKDTEDPSASVFREPWSIKRERIRKSSPYGHIPNWDVLSVIVKSGADLRQELLALQLIAEMGRIWKQAGVLVWVYSFRILITSEHSALIETIRDAISIHSIKKEGYARQLNQQGIAYTLYDYFIKEFGQPGCESFEIAQDNFMRSLAGYSIACYLLQIKDRHNGNILMDLEGHCVHIDFGFVLTNSPGSVGFELAPFKLPQEYIDIIGGVRSAKFAEFRSLIKEAFLALRKSADAIVCLVEAMEKDSTLPCFTGVTPKPTQLSGQNAPTPSAAAAVFAAAAAIGNMNHAQANGDVGFGANGLVATTTGGGNGVTHNTVRFSMPAPPGTAFDTTGGALYGANKYITSTPIASTTVSPVPLPPAPASTTTSANKNATKPASAAKYPVADALRERFQLGLTDSQVSDFVDRIVDSSCNNMFTKLYDSFQYYANGIL